MKTSQEGGSVRGTPQSSPRRTGRPGVVYPLHGAFAIPDPRHGYVVIEVHHGTVTSICGESITVTSPDGYTRRYDIDPDDIRRLELSSGVALTPGCQLAITTSAGRPPRVFGIQAPSDERARQLGSIPSPPTPA